MFDWRIQGQERYLKNVGLTRKDYVSYRDDWDHDHCEFCSAKFSVTKPGALHIGYVTDDNYHWICDQCFEDFKKNFGWIVHTSE